MSLMRIIYFNVSQMFSQRHHFPSFDLDFRTSGGIVHKIFILPAVTIPKDPTCNLFSFHGYKKNLLSLMELFIMMFFLNF